MCFFLISLCTFITILIRHVDIDAHRQTRRPPGFGVLVDANSNEYSTSEKSCNEDCSVICGVEEFGFKYCVDVAVSPE